MARVETNAVCVRHWPYSETSQIVLLLGETTGLVRALAKGSLRDDPRFSGGLELTDVGVADVIVPDSGAMATLAGWDLVRSFPGLRRRMGAFESAMFMLDFVSGFLGEQDPHPASYRALVDGLSGLDGGEAADRFGVLLRLEWAVLCEAGYRPVLEGGEATGGGAGGRVRRFSPDSGGLTSDRSLRAWEVRESTVERLRGLDGAESGASGSRVDERAAALLAAYGRELLGRSLAGEEGVFGGALPRPRSGASPEKG